MSLAARSGVLWGLDDRMTPFSDRFHLGGPMSVRMFRVNGLGPQDGRALSAEHFTLYPSLMLVLSRLAGGRPVLGSRAECHQRHPKEAALACEAA